MYIEPAALVPLAKLTRRCKHLCPSRAPSSYPCSMSSNVVYMRCAHVRVHQKLLQTVLSSERRAQYPRKDGNVPWRAGPDLIATARLLDRLPARHVHAGLHLCIQVSHLRANPCQSFHDHSRNKFRYKGSHAVLTMQGQSNKGPFPSPL